MKNKPTQGEGLPLPTTATIYDLAGKILRDNVAAPTRTAAFLARRRRSSVVVEDWDRCRRYRVTSHGTIRPAPRDWIPDPISAEPTLAIMRADPAHYARELERHRLTVLARARDRAAVRTWNRQQARRKRDAPIIEARLAATILVDEANRELEVMAR